MKNTYINYKYLILQRSCGIPFFWFVSKNKDSRFVPGILFCLNTEKRLYSTSIVYNGGEIKHSPKWVTGSSPSKNDKIIKLHPYFVTGFADAESSFIISIRTNNKLKTGWRVEASFQIGLHEKDRIILESIKAFYGVGNISKQREDSFQYRVVGSVKELKVIIDHFDKYPLISQKRADYILFKQAFDLISRKEHLTKEGLHKIILLKSALNLGLSETLEASFPGVKPIDRPQIDVAETFDPNWIAGFTEGEGCFFVNLYNAPVSRLGKEVKLKFTIAQHGRDRELMNSLIKYFNCGKLYSNGSCFYFTVSKFDDINNKIIPFFVKFTLIGVKNSNYKDFCKVANLLEQKAHLTQAGLAQIIEIKSGMNKGRDHGGSS